MVQAGRQGAQGRWEALQAGLARVGSSERAGPEQSPDEQEEVRETDRRGGVPGRSQTERKTWRQGQGRADQEDSELRIPPGEVGGHENIHNAGVGRVVTYSFVVIYNLQSALLSSYLLSIILEVGITIMFPILQIRKWRLMKSRDLLKNKQLLSAGAELQARTLVPMSIIINIEMGRRERASKDDRIRCSNMALSHHFTPPDPLQPPSCLPLGAGDGHGKEEIRRR